MPGGEIVRTPRVLASQDTHVSTYIHIESVAYCFIYAPQCVSHSNLLTAWSRNGASYI